MVAKQKSKFRHGFALVSPKRAGLCDRPLRELCTATKTDVNLRSISGASHIILHKGKCVFACSKGLSDCRKRVKFSERSICRLHGCSKPLVAAAFLTLVDQGKVRLSDPVSKYIRFPNRVAAKRGGAQRPAVRPATLRNLMTMTAGLGYEDCKSYKPIMRKVKQGKIRDLGGMCDAIADLPMVANPGTRYNYSFATDVLGRVCEVASGETLDKFVSRSLLTPLGMKDTHFIVPAKKRHRIAVLYDAKRIKQRTGTKGARYKLKAWSGPRAAGILSAGGGILSYSDPGMWSTARDYAHFCQMILNNGVAPNGKRILRDSTAKSLWKDALAAYSRADGRLPGWNDADGPGTRGGYWDYTGCGLLHTHLTFKSAPSRSRPRRAPSMWMAGGGGVNWVVDAERQTVAISFLQGFGGRTSDDDGLGSLGTCASGAAREAVDEAPRPA